MIWHIFRGVLIFWAAGAALVGIIYVYYRCTSREILVIERTVYKKRLDDCEIKIKRLEGLIEKQKDLIARAAPLVWIHDGDLKYTNDAYQWEKDAEQILKEEL